MGQFTCPLCKQEVSKSVFEKITGIWQEKEKRLQALKNKEKELQQKEQKLLKKLEEDKKKFAVTAKAKFQSELTAKVKSLTLSFQKERAKIEQEKANIEKSYKNRLAAETNRLLNMEKVKREHLQVELKKKFEKDVKIQIEKANKVLEKDKGNFEREKRVQSNRYNQLHKQFSALQSKNVAEIQKRETRIRQLQEQLKKNQTPSELGFENERDLLEKLKEKFPADRFAHTGKGGDIVHYVVAESKEIGVIVYELKKVSNFSNSHIQQALDAKQQRDADYAVLITNAKRSKTDFGFSLAKGVIIVHPAGAMTIITILRDHLITLSKLKLSNKQRDEAAKAILEYIQSPVFTNSIESIIANTIDLHTSMKKEIKEHINIWQDRFNRYNEINNKAALIENRVVKLIDSKGKARALKDTRISPIELPSEIK